MKLHKKLIKYTLLFPLIVCFLSVGYSQAIENTIAEYPAGAYESSYQAAAITVVHPSATAVFSANYQTFKVNFNDTLLTKIDVWGVKINNPVGVLRLALYNVTGTYGSTSIPDQVIETSTTDYAMASAQTGGAYMTFNFAGTTPLYAGTAYAWVLYEYSETTCDASNTVRTGYDSIGSGASSDGNSGYYSSNGFSSSTTQTYDLIFKVYGEGGTAVSYAGGNIYIDNIENQYTIDATAEFNNTVVSAEGGTSSTTATPINYYNSAAIILLAIICIALTVKPSVPILNFCFGIITFGIAAATAGQTDMLLYGYIQILAVIMAIICMLSGYNSWKR